MRVQAAVPQDESWLSTAEIERAAGLMVPARRRGWLLRRWTAKQALSAVFGPPLGRPSELEIANRDDGAPVVGWRGELLAVGISLTDRADWAACAIAPAGAAVGCDLELIEPRTAAFVADYFTPAEQRIVARSADRALAANLVWSAKESALKVTGDGLRRPTRSVEVQVDPAATGRGFSPLAVSLAEGGTLTGWWRRLGPYVLTLAAASPTPLEPPRFLGGPLPGVLPAYA
jgi:4'-phosphopantetheinyl transferase